MSGSKQSQYVCLGFERPIYGLRARESLDISVELILWHICLVFALIFFFTGICVSSCLLLLHHLQLPWIRGKRLRSLGHYFIIYITYYGIDFYPKYSRLYLTLLFRHSTHQGVQNVDHIVHQNSKGHADRQQSSHSGAWPRNVQSTKAYHTSRLIMSSQPNPTQPLNLSSQVACKIIFCADLHHQVSNQLS